MVHIVTLTRDIAPTQHTPTQIDKTPYEIGVPESALAMSQNRRSWLGEGGHCFCRMPNHLPLHLPAYTGFQAQYPAQVGLPADWYEEGENPRRDQSVTRSPYVRYPAGSPGFVVNRKYRSPEVQSAIDELERIGKELARCPRGFSFGCDVNRRILEADAQTVADRLTHHLWLIEFANGARQSEVTEGAALSLASGEGRG